MKRELERLEIWHDWCVKMDRKMNAMDIALLAMIVLANICCVSAGVERFVDGMVGIFIFEMVLVFVNTANFIFTIYRMVRRRKSSKREQELYESARNDLLKLIESEESELEDNGGN